MTVVYDAEGAEMDGLGFKFNIRKPFGDLVNKNPLINNPITNTVFKALLGKNVTQIGLKDINVKNAANVAAVGVNFVPGIGTLASIGIGAAIKVAQKGSLNLSDVISAGIDVATSGALKGNKTFDGAVNYLKDTAAGRLFQKAENGKINAFIKTQLKNPQLQAIQANIKAQIFQKGDNITDSDIAQLTTQAERAGALTADITSGKLDDIFPSTNTSLVTSQQRSQATASPDGTMKVVGSTNSYLLPVAAAGAVALAIYFATKK